MKLCRVYLVRPFQCSVDCRWKPLYEEGLIMSLVLWFFLSCVPRLVLSVTTQRFSPIALFLLLSLLLVSLFFPISSVSFSSCLFICPSVSSLTSATHVLFFLFFLFHDHFPAHSRQIKAPVGFYGSPLNDDHISKMRLLLV